MTDDRKMIELLKRNRPQPTSRPGKGLSDQIWRKIELEPGGTMSWGWRFAAPSFVLAIAVATSLWVGTSRMDPADLSLAQDVEWAFAPLDGEELEMDPGGIFLEIAGGI